MYYVAGSPASEMSATYAHLMNNAFVGTALLLLHDLHRAGAALRDPVRSPWIRKANTVALEGMHLGIIACMGLVCFGLLMIGADCTLPARRGLPVPRAALPVRQGTCTRRWSPLPARGMTPVAMTAGQDGAADA